VDQGPVRLHHLVPPTAAQPLWRNNFTFFGDKVLGSTMHPSSYLFGNRLAQQQA
jgi:hypothetical protein